MYGNFQFPSAHDHAKGRVRRNCTNKQSETIPERHQQIEPFTMTLEEKTNRPKIRTCFPSRRSLLFLKRNNHFSSRLPPHKTPIAFPSSTSPTANSCSNNRESVDQMLQQPAHKVPSGPYLEGPARVDPVGRARRRLLPPVLVVVVDPSEADSVTERRLFLYRVGVVPGEEARR